MLINMNAYTRGGREGRRRAISQGSVAAVLSFRSRGRSSRVSRRVDAIAASGHLHGEEHSIERADRLSPIDYVGITSERRGFSRIFLALGRARCKCRMNRHHVVTFSPHAEIRILDAEISSGQPRGRAPCDPSSDEPRDKQQSSITSMKLHKDASL